MKIILKIAWRNIWRNPRRSFVLITSIAVGVFGYLGTIGFSRGFINQMIETTINLYGGHILISAKGHHDNPQIRLFIEEPERIARVLNEIPGISYAHLVSFQGMINSSESASGVMINGVIPEKESKITISPQSITQGNYLTKRDDRNEIVIGEVLAEKLNVELGEKIVLMATDLENNINSGAYRIAGLFRTTSTDFDKSFVFIHQKQAQSLVGYSKGVTAFTVRLNQNLELESVVDKIKTNLNPKQFEVLSWKDRNPLLVLTMEAYDNSIVLIVGILFIAIAFSIANSFLMVIYERIYEFGIMLANGVLPKKIRLMLFLEAFFITLIGTLFGLIISAAILGYWGHVGLDLSAFAQGLAKFGVGALVYPDLVASDVIIGLLVIQVVVLLSVIYPSIKASRFAPAEAINFV
jgi:ABC-type lipoprotein release transport system permease subunit